MEILINFNLFFYSLFLLVQTTETAVCDNSALNDKRLCFTIKLSDSIKVSSISSCRNVWVRFLNDERHRVTHFDNVLAAAGDTYSSCDMIARAFALTRVHHS